MAVPHGMDEQPPSADGPRRDRLRRDRPRRDRPSGLSDSDHSSLGPTRKSSPRLATFDYTGPYAYSITLNTAARQRVFTSEAVVDDCLKALMEASSKNDFLVYAYCFMPDHVHLLVEGSEDSSLISFMKRFKQVSGHRYNQEFGRALWHRSYYDHVLRQEEDRRVVAEYIWNNPVQAGLVVSREAYAFSGPRELMVLGEPAHSDDRQSSERPDRPEGLSLQGLASQDYLLCSMQGGDLA